MRDVVVVLEKSEKRSAPGFHLEQQLPRMSNCQSVRRDLTEDPNKAEFRDRTACKLCRTLASHPSGDALVKRMTPKAKSHQCIHIEKIFHGKSASISSTASLVRSGTSPSTSRTGKPVNGSVMILTPLARLRWGVRTILIPSMRASIGSPARRSSLRRNDAGSTT
jgi:hypothetical protein